MVKAITRPKKAILVERHFLIKYSDAIKSKGTSISTFTVQYWSRTIGPLIIKQMAEARDDVFLNLSVRMSQ